LIHVIAILAKTTPPSGTNDRGMRSASIHEWRQTMRMARLMLTGAALIAAGATPALANTSEFLTKAIKGDNSEMKLGALAAAQGQSTAVKGFGRMLERDHSKARTQAAPLARRHHVAVPTAMMPEAKAEYAKLQAMHGAAFDQEFARYMVQDHEKDIADFEKETKSSDPADVRALAKTTLPTLRKHLATARSIR
jgi:putative membrane protein